MIDSPYTVKRELLKNYLGRFLSRKQDGGHEREPWIWRQAENRSAVWQKPPERSELNILVEQGDTISKVMQER